MAKSVFRTDVGLVRQVNQDSVFATDAPLGPLSALYIVADGLGGHRGGEVASREAIDTFVDGVTYSANPKDIASWLCEQVKIANHRVLKHGERDLSLYGMGTTFVAAAVYGDTVYVVNVGDSRCYMMGTDGMFQQVSVDHSLVQEMVENHEITPEEARIHPQRNIITRALGTDRDVEADVFKIPVSVIDTLLLCSDGLCGEIEPGVLTANLVAQNTLEEKADNLLEATFHAGARDNVTFVLVDFTKSNSKKEAER